MSLPSFLILKLSARSSFDCQSHLTKAQICPGRLVIYIILYATYKHNYIHAFIPSQCTRKALWDLQEPYLCQKSASRGGKEVPAQAASVVEDVVSSSWWSSLCCIIVSSRRRILFYFCLLLVFGSSNLYRFSFHPPLHILEQSCFFLFFQTVWHDTLKNWTRWAAFGGILCCCGFSCLVCHC